MPSTSIRIGKVRGEDGHGVVPGGAIGQVLTKKSSIDFDTEWHDAVFSINQQTPTDGNVDIDTGVMTINEQSPTNGNIDIDTGVMTINEQYPTDGNIDIDTGVMTINQQSPTDGNIDIDTGVMDVEYDTTNKKITITADGQTTDVVTASALKTDMNLNKVENKTSSEIRNEITDENVSSALGYDSAESLVATYDQIDALFA